QPTDLLLDRDAMRAVGIDVVCGDGAHRFLPLPTAVVGVDAITITSPLVLLEADELAFYRSRSFTLSSLRGRPVERDGATLGALLDGANLHYRVAATGSFLVAVTNNYLLNRLWTFRHHRGHFGYQGLRFFVVSVLVYAGNLAILTVLVELGLGKIVSQALAIVLVTPANFIGNKLWSFRRGH